ncbi:hypothetical protein [Pontivivens ytuae]|uniref:Uncharacterized protein n=1 Tax=Pontivivens ytuae TaxID=2789856 RepID=A0A7S9LVZ5_9RHOB|nr:hypothetical protein [Pontivivens ytuae]QPH55990.1 hypothetical protein I0K15_09780 [Pontivivens ytuae]
MCFNILMVVQRGRLAYEAVLALASLPKSTRVLLAEPQPGPLWPEDPRVGDDDLYEFYRARGAEVVPLRNRVFGAAYPHGNKIEALGLLPEGEPFLFLDTDTLFLREPDLPDQLFERPAASLRRVASWPKVSSEEQRAEIWQALYNRFGIALQEDERWPVGDWRRFPYFNAGWVLGPCPHRFGAQWHEIAEAIWREPGPVLEEQALTPWLDQIALPLTIAAEGGVQRDVPGLDGDITCHWRTLPLAYARESDAVIARLEEVAQVPRIKKLLKRYPPFHQMLYRGGGAEVRAMFADGVAEDEAVIRRRLKDARLWVR